MISVKRHADASGKQFYLVESRLPDGKLQCITRSSKFRCNTHGFEDGDARSKALRFAITTDTLPDFRSFIFSDVDVAGGRIEGPVSPHPTRLDSHVVVSSSQESLKRKIRSYVCMRQNRLTGLRFVIGMSRLESGRLRAVSFQDPNLVGASNSDEALNKAVRFLRGVAFESWRKQAMNELISRDREPAGHRRERALKHVSAFVEIEAGEKLDCACGKNRSRGLMVACERCGAWEHAECQGFRSDKQIPADYICSACMRAEREDVVVIRLDEQGECGNLQLEDLWTDAKIRETDVVCCVCGCEDNQDFENMISSKNEHACDGGTALAHPSCISAAQHLAHEAWNGKAMAAGMCQLCGDRSVKSPKGNDEVYSHTSSGVSQSKPPKGSLSPNQSQNRNSRRAAKLDQTARGAKRLRSALTNGGLVAKQEVVDKRQAKGVKEETDVQAAYSGEKMELTSPETNKSSVQQAGLTLPDRRFSDAAVTVPIKKRRLMMEVVCSPSPPRSPPPRSASRLPQVDDVLAPKSELVDQIVVKEIEKEVVQGSEDAEMVEVGPVTHVKADVSVGNHDGTSGSLEVDVADESLWKLSPQGGKFVDRSHVPGIHGSLGAPPYKTNSTNVPAARGSNLQESQAAGLGAGHDELTIRGSPHTLTSADEDGWDIGKDENDVDGKDFQHEELNLLGDAENKDAGATSSASQSRSRDVRLHWDLNMDMEEWERPLEEDTGTFSGLHQDLASNSSPVNDVNASHDDKASPLAENDHVSPVHTEVEPVVQVGQAVHVHGEGDAIMEDPEVEVEGDASSTDAGSVESKHHVKTEELNSATKESSVEEYSDLLEPENVDYDDSDSRNGDEVGSDAEERVESEWQVTAGKDPSELAGGVQDGVRDEERKVGLVDERFGEGECVLKLTGDVNEGIIVEGIELDIADADTDSESVGLKSLAALEPGLELKETQDVLQQELQEGKVHFHGEVVEGQSSDKAETEKAETEKAKTEKVESVPTREDKQVQDAKEASTPGSSVRRADGQSRTKSSGWDQLPEGFDKPEDALRAAKENPAVRSGRGPLWGTANGRGASNSPRGGSVASRFGRGLRPEGVGDRARSEDSWTREDHQRIQRVNDNVDISPRIASPREPGRGRSHGRGGSPAVRARGRMEPWMDSSSGPTSPWGPNRHHSPPGHYSEGFGHRGPTNAAARALLKVESSGFVVAPDGTLTKAGSSGRGPPRPFQSGGRNGRGVMFNMGRGGPGMNMGVGMNLGGMRVNMGMGRGMGMGPGMGMNMGMSMGMGMGGGPGLGLSIPGRGGPGGRGMVDRYSGGPYSGCDSAGSPVVEHSSASRRGRSHEDYNENWSRREDRSASPRKRRSSSRRSRSRTPSRSKSQTRSPKARTPPRLANSSGSGGGVLGKSSKKRSHSPATYKPEVRGERAESPPARRSVPPPKLPLPPPPPRSHRSPPAGLKRLSDNKKDGDQARSRERERERERARERERERPATRARTPPRRTSPHVVHGSALMDERDRQSLAASARNRSSEVPGTGAVTSSRDSPPLASPVGRIAEGTSEARRHSGDEGMESRIHGPKMEDAGIKIEQRSSKETFRSERERNTRRDGGRDRDEERRDVSKSSYNSRDRDGRSSSSLKYNREGDDDVAPRRRRPSP